MAEAVVVPSGPTEQPVRAVPRVSVVIADARQLDDVDLSEVEALDLALSELDAQERPLPLPAGPSPSSSSGDASGESGQNDPEAVENGDPAQPQVAAARVHPRCEGLDLHTVAERAPRLRSLRISGCQAAVHAGLSAFGERLRELELVDLELDPVTVARLAQLHGLESLALTRVHAEPDALKPLGRKISPRSILLRELASDSDVAEIFGILRDIRDVRIEGAWATHRTMVFVGKAKQLESLALIDTTIGNYSLHQIKPLDHLHRLEWSGTGFNDSSILFIKDLPIDELICSCSRFGDKGLDYLDLLEGLRVLELDRSQVSSAGLAALVELQKLEEIRLRNRTIDGDGFAALAQLPALRELDLTPGTLADPLAPHLGELVGLRELSIALDGFDDRAAKQLATLTALEVLDLGGAQLSDEGLESLAPLTRLRVLELHHTRVTKHGLKHLAGMKDLQVLELDHTDVVDEGVAYLVGLEKLVELRLDHTLITDAALAHVAQITSLERLNLAGTVVTATGVEVLEGLPNLKAVNLAGTRALGQR